MSGDRQWYGPNSRLVEAFILRLREAPVRDWRQALGRAPAGLQRRRAEAARLVGRHRDRDAAIAAARECLDEIARNVSLLARYSPFFHVEDVLAMHEVAHTAAWALVMRDRLEPADFEILYWPFAVAFPVAELEAAP